MNHIFSPEPVSGDTGLRLRGGFLVCLKSNTPNNTKMPSTSLKVMSEKGGMTSMTALLTTYIPPQMEAAARPERRPKSDLCMCSLLRGGDAWLADC